MYVLHLCTLTLPIDKVISPLWNRGVIIALSLSKKVHTEDIEQETCYILDGIQNSTLEFERKFLWSFKKRPDKQEFDTTNVNVAK